MSTESKDQKDAPKVAAKADEAKPFFAEAYRYVGPGIVFGVPDRDLTSFDVARIPPDFLREVHASEFYAPATDAELGGA